MIIIIINSMKLTNSANTYTSLANNSSGNSIISISKEYSHSVINACLSNKLSAKICNLLFLSQFIINFSSPEEEKFALIAIKFLITFWLVMSLCQLVKNICCYEVICRKQSIFIYIQYTAIHRKRGGWYNFLYITFDCVQWCELGGKLNNFPNCVMTHFHIWQKF